MRKDDEDDEESEANSDDDDDEMREEDEGVGAVITKEENETGKPTIANNSKRNCKVNKREGQMNTEKTKINRK